eukprot:1142261-Pelagomonas_calceolata.AAC.9
MAAWARADQDKLLNHTSLLNVHFVHAGAVTDACETYACSINKSMCASRARQAAQIPSSLGVQFLHAGAVMKAYETQACSIDKSMCASRVRQAAQMPSSLGEQIVHAGAVMKAHSNTRHRSITQESICASRARKEAQTHAPVERTTHACWCSHGSAVHSHLVSWKSKQEPHTVTNPAFMTGNKTSSKMCLMPVSCLSHVCGTEEAFGSGGRKSQEM